LIQITTFETLADALQSLVKEDGGTSGEWRLTMNEKEKRSEVRRQEGSGNLLLRSTLHILKSLTTYEKNCFVLNHSLSRHCLSFLRGKMGTTATSTPPGNGPSFAVAYTA
jgi:hypothetical protein